MSTNEERPLSDDGKKEIEDGTNQRKPSTNDDPNERQPVPSQECQTDHPGEIEMTIMAIEFSTTK